MQKQIEFTFTMGSDVLVYTEWNKLRRQLAMDISRDFGGCRFVHGEGAWRDGAESSAGTYPGKLHHDETLSLIIAVPTQSAEAAFGIIQDTIAAAVHHFDLGDRIDWIDTTQREVVAHHWQVSSKLILS